MITNLRALKAATDVLWPTYLWQAPMVSPTQLLIWQAPSAGGSDELPVAAADVAIDAPLRLMARAETGDAVAIMLDRVQKLLSPSRLPGPLPVAGRAATIRWIRAEFIAPDVDASVDSTSRNPFYGVDSYHLISQPRS